MAQSACIRGLDIHQRCTGVGFKDNGLLVFRCGFVGGDLGMAGNTILRETKEQTKVLRVVLSLPQRPTEIVGETETELPACLPLP